MSGPPPACGLGGVSMEEDVHVEGAEQRSLHLFGSGSEMSSVSHYASGTAGQAQPEVYEKQRERKNQEGGNST